MTREECKLSIVYLEGIKDNYIEGNGYERHPLPEYYAIETAIKALEQEPCVDAISRQAAIDAVKDAVIKDEQQYAEDALKALPSAQPEWNNHTVACMLAELFDDTCACNYNGIDEWLPSKCELLDSCPNPVGVACWEQFLKHKAKRRSDE